MHRFLFAASLALATQAGAEGPVSGEKLFMLHCASCHGRAGRGNGSMASALKVAPSDLTRITQRNGGVFPTADVIGQIDGRSGLAAHGGTMPVYGWFFQGPEASVSLPDGSAIVTTKPIKEIIVWLQSQQGS